MAPDEAPESTEPTFETPEGAEADPPRQPDTVEVPEGARSAEADAASASTDGVYGDADPALEPGSE